MKNSLNGEILKYFLLFAFLILGMLWIFQSLFFNAFYREQKINDITIVSKKIKSKQDNSDFFDIVNNLAFDKSVCIEIIDNNYYSVYASTFLGKVVFQMMSQQEDINLILLVMIMIKKLMNLLIINLIIRL